MSQAPPPAPDSTPPGAEPSPGAKPPAQVLGASGASPPSQEAPHELPASLLHDLRTPLNQVIGYSEMLAEQAQDEGRADLLDDLDKLRAAGQQLLRLISESFVPLRHTPAAPEAPPPTPPEPTPVTPSSSAARPALEDGALTAGALEPLASGEGAGLLLVVDDNEVNRDVLSRRLQRQGYATATAVDGRQALEMVRSRAFDLVLLDIMMPEVDGYEVLRQLKADEALRHLPVIMISALDELDSVARCIEMGAEDYLPKPFNPTLLKARVGACLDKKRGRDREQRLFAQLQENYRLLQELEQMRDNLTHMIVHDLRTPLSALLTGLHTMVLLGPLGDEQRECYDIAVRGGGTLLSMVNDLLDISKMESGTFVLEAAPTPLLPLLEEATEQVAATAHSKQLALVRQVEPGLPLLRADAGALRRILVNLLGNAQKFTPPRGTITLAAQRALDASAGESVLFAISDTGEGIPPDSFEKIFEKFGQVEGRRAGRRMSSGLGLTFCKMAVEAHGGRIWLTSTLGEGSTFFFTIPLHADALPPAQ